MRTGNDQETIAHQRTTASFADFRHLGLAGGTGVWMIEGETWTLVAEVLQDDVGGIGVVRGGRGGVEWNWGPGVPVVRAPFEDILCSTNDISSHPSARKHKRKWAHLYKSSSVTRYLNKRFGCAIVFGSRCECGEAKGRRARTSRWDPSTSQDHKVDLDEGDGAERG